MNEIHVEKFAEMKMAQQGLCNQANIRAQPDHIRENLALFVQVKSSNEVAKSFMISLLVTT